MGYILVEYSVCIYIISLEIYTYLLKKTCIITEFVSYKTFKGQRRFSPHLHNTSESNSSYLHVHFRRLALTRCQKRVAQNPWKKTHGCCKFLQKTTEVPSPPQKNRLKGAYPCGSFHKNFLSFGGGKAPKPPRHHEIPQVSEPWNSHLDSGAFHRLGSTCRGVATQGGGFTNQALMHQGDPPKTPQKNTGKIWGFGIFFSEP